MDPVIVETVGPMLAVLGVGSMILIGLKMRYTHLRETRHGAIGREDLERLAEDVAHLSDDIRLLREEFADLSERVDFAERVLTRGKADGDVDALPKGAAD